MGMVLLPVIIGALVIFVRSIFQLKTLIQSNELSVAGILLGLLIPISIIVYISRSWIKEGKVYQFTPIFYFPIRLFFLPWVIGFVYKTLPLGNSAFIHTSLVTWIVFSGLLIVLLYQFHKTYMEKNGVKYTY